MSPSPLSLHHSNPSMYTLDTVHDGEDSALLTPTTPSYGATALHSPPHPSSKRLIFNATFKMAVVFIVSTALLGGTLWLALPTLEEEDRPKLKIPKSFEQLQDLNYILKKYRDIYPTRIFVCYVTTYLFLQAFSLPGSMYLSILGGAVWGVARALPLACCCVATGASLCYFISAALGPALLTLPRWKARLDTWATKIQNNKENMISFLIVLRIAPLPPHWVVNVVCPHVGIGIVPFWISTFLGIFGVSVIHTTIGGGLDEMTSAADFHLISLKNALGLSAIVVGVLIPVGLRYWFRGQVQDVAHVEDTSALDNDDVNVDEVAEDMILAVGPRSVIPKAKTRALDDGYEEYSSSEDEDEDVILEAGPEIKSPKFRDQQVASSSRSSSR